MSYILDALKRAESERDRGAVPTLNTPLPTRTPASGNARPLLYVAIAGAVLLILAGALGSRWLSTAPAPQTEAAMIAAPVSPPTAPAATPAALPGDQQSIQPTTQTTAQPTVQPIAPTMTQQPRPMPPQAQAELQRQPLVPAAHSLPAQVPAAKPALVAPAPIVALNELPESLRRELPPLKAGGAMVSDIPANRMLIINGQLLHEGEAVVPGLVLENIGLRTAILSYKSQRFTINY